MDFYAVKEGYKIGVFDNWKDCEIQVKGYPGASYKKFDKLEEAVEFIDENKVIVYRSKRKEKKKNIIEIKDKDDEILNIKDEKNLSDGEIVAYVDGSFDLKSFTYSYGVVYFSKEGKETYSGRESDPDLAQMRNVSGELKGAMVAMENAYNQNIDVLYLHYDYKGIEEWALGRWKTNKEGTKKYKEFYDSIKDKLKVIFIKVPAHAGITYNEEADRLAKEAL